MRAIDCYVGARACMPSAAVAVRLAQALGVSVEYLVTGAVSPAPAAAEEAERSNQIQLYKKIPCAHSDDGAAFATKAEACYQACGRTGAAGVAVAFA